MKIDEFLEEIRRCRLCERDPTSGFGTPFVYSSSSPDVLVVSEMPSAAAWKEDIGTLWAKRDLFTRSTDGVPHRLCEWLGLKRDEAKDRFFWIQRANCTVSVGESFAFQHCSSRFLGRALEIVRPNLILALGEDAAGYFFQFDKLENVMGRVMTYPERDGDVQRKYHCIVLYHPSSAAKKWHKRPEHMKSIALAKQRILESRP